MIIICKTELTAKKKTNQKDFAKIDKGVISSCARNGQSNNRDAIGREPMVQVVLKNTSNKEVVDVRYFKIAWTAKRVDTPLETLLTLLKSLFAIKNI